MYQMFDRTPAGEALLSVVVPLYNEEDNVKPLMAELLGALEKLSNSFEILLVNDGSTDRTSELMAQIAASDSRIKVVNFRRNAGQTAALMAGFDYASGQIIVPMDGDLQNDPADIQRLLQTMGDRYDVVSGWRKNRQDNALFRKLPSLIANMIISRVSGVRLHDYGCTLKAYRREILLGFRLYGEMHRFVPIFASWQGAKITELAVNHRPRTAGKSKYGLERIFKVMLDLFLVRFLTQYATKPIYVFGSAGFFFILIGFIAAVYALWLKYVDGISFILTPLPTVVAFSFMSGIICTLMGLIAELLMRTYFEARGRVYYIVASTLNLNPASKSGDSECAG